MTKDKDIKTTVPTLRFREFQNDARWIPNKIDHVCKIGNGRDYKHLSAGNIPVYGSGGYMTSVDKFLYDGESVCIGRKGTIDKPIFLTGKFWTVDTLFYTYAFHKCLPKFLYLIFQQINWYKYNEAGGVPSLLKTTIGNINIFIPNNENEQKKIVDCFSSLDDLINAVADKIETLKEYKKGLMQQLFPAKGKTIPAIRFPEFQNAPDWQETALENIGEIVTGNTPSTKEPNNYGGDRLFVSPADISDKRYVSQTKTTLSEKGFRLSRHIKENSILFVCIGSTIGKVAQNTRECATNQQINSIMPYKGHVADFVYSILEHYAPQIASIAGNQAVPIINKTLFSSVSLLMPKENEQQKIADCLSSVDELISTETAKLDQLKAHKKGLMQQLFPKLQ
ncbi:MULTISPECIES: restriction endonuclease subunit S [Parabacteroides]|uniref:restriction endonuclease subunit S n=1 Tax=Parabacteroides TaxID=375288 RepID=UPI00189A0EBE|nr:MULTISPECIES: restriction endonuclease subunit S [Parabacteroides]MCI7416148.1 restriction endonuclease subunit S [Parabacteroides distasonis]MDB9149174.1 restriction endonuclease subunit S [Parabacteroides distasonis]MDY4657595.1 restriction endonuclease subunit S [Parabacteroides distasonis]